jgi:type IV secretory pathway VirJ component
MTALALLLLLAAAPSAAALPSVPGGRFGRVELFRPASEPARAVLYLHGGAALDAGGRALAAALAQDGALVLGLSASSWARRAARDRCAYPAGDLEWVAQAAEKQLGLRSYLHPIVVGEGAGATVAHAALAQAPGGAFPGSIGIGPHADPTPAVRFCGAAARPRSGAPPRRDLAGRQLGPLREAIAAVDAAARPAPTPAPSAGPAVSDLPLVEAPVDAKGGSAFALLVTGDGGWAGIDREIAAALVAKGLPVVGLDSLKYFWTRRTPEGFAADVARIIEHYAAVWGRSEVALVGYSRGADVLPAAAVLLPAGARARVKVLAILGAGREAEFELHLTDFLGSGSGGRPVLPDVERLAGTPIVCIYGREEAGESLCPLLRARAGTRVVELAGSHHFDGDYAGVAREVVKGLETGEAAR